MSYRPKRRVPAFRQELYKTLTAAKSRHGRGTDWVRENRRRRSCGLPQKRVLPDGAVHDPMAGTIERTVAGGVREVTHLAS